MLAAWKWLNEGNLWHHKKVVYFCVVLRFFNRFSFYMYTYSNSCISVIKYRNQLYHWQFLLFFFASSGISAIKPATYYFYVQHLGRCKYVVNFDYLSSTISLIYFRTWGLLLLSRYDCMYFFQFTFTHNLVVQMYECIRWNR